MSESKSEKKRGEEERRFDPELLKEGLQCDLEQYDMLMRCSEKGAEGIKEWNEWREQHLGEVILLEGADFLGARLSRVDLSDYGGIASPPQVCLRDASFIRANLEHGRFCGADLRDVDFTEADLIDAMLSGARLENATLHGVRLNGRYGMHNFYWRGACFDGAQLQGADLRRAIVDSSTSFWECALDRDSDFREVALGSVQLEHGKKELLRYNIRRMNWEDWYREHWFWRWPVRAFWAMSDYGMSTGRVVIWFFVLAFLFAAVYMNWAYWRPPGIVSNLIVQPEIGEAVWHYCLRVPVRAVYFSVVTMTTLGFGDMYANKGSIAGHVILAVQVILGYVLLGALITRFAVLFTAGGPAGKFVNRGS